MLSFLFLYADAGVLVMRLAIAVIFIVHGMRKLNGSMGSFMTFIGVVETLGALGLILGLFTQIAAMGLTVVMAGAMYKKIFEWSTPFTAMDKMGWEFDLILFAACVALMTFGAGMYSLEARWFI
jgi:putative oxidoreductase